MTDDRGRHGGTHRRRGAGGLRELPDEVDVLVVGGGITGAAIAYEAASRGFSVALVERDDFGGATSAATGKLIHGGLRYLKSLQVGLVRESLRERRILSDIAPHLVYPFPMVLPDPGTLERIGLVAYDLLSFDRGRTRDPDKRIPAHRHLDARGLAARGIEGHARGILYYDAMMISPERLTLAFARSAEDHGAAIANHTEAIGLDVAQGREGRRVVGARVRDRLDGGESAIRARLVVNATGPWAHDVLSGERGTARAAGPAPGVRSEGIYLVTRRLTETMLLHVSPRGHFSFAPWRGHSLIGPTERPYRGAVSDWRLTRGSVEDFLAVVNATARLDPPLAYDDVEFAYGGLRPLAEAAGDDTYNASRGSELVDHAADGVDGIVTATGGKYTTSRAFAQKAFRVVRRKVGKAAGPSISARAPLHGADVGPSIEAFVRGTVAGAPDVSPSTAEHLARHYGTEAPAVLALARDDPALARTLDDDGEVLAQAAFAIREERARTLTDVVLRRTGIGTLGPSAEGVLECVADLAAAELGWDAPRRERELAQARRATSPPS